VGFKFLEIKSLNTQGQTQNFKLGGALKQIAPSGGRRNIFGGIVAWPSIYVGHLETFLLRILNTNINYLDKDN
jgi:hypothetical protein